MRQTSKNTTKGLGIDIEEVSRFSQKPFLKHKTFYKKIFTENEIKYCMSKLDPYPYFTARFCAKEATIKALKHQDLKLNEIEIIRENKIPNLVNIPNVHKKKIQLSLSHTAKYAIAIVMVDE